MPKTLVVTDASACLSPRAEGRAGLRVLPVTIHLSGDDRAEGVVDAATVWQAMGEGRHVWARAPSSGDYLVAAEERAYDGAVVVTPAAELAVMADNAHRAARMASTPMAVVDSRTTASAHGLVVEAALEAAAE